MNKPPIILKLKPLERESIARGIPILGSSKGAWLAQKVQQLKPKQILELGTANGYSGIILGSEGAELTTLEINAVIAQEATENFERFKINAKIILGDAVETVKNLLPEKESSYDLIFIDFAKNKYIQVLENCLKLIRKGGFIIADNITMDGCQKYKDAVLNHPLLKTELIYIKDGISCSEKI